MTNPPAVTIRGWAGKPQSPVHFGHGAVEDWNSFNIKLHWPAIWVAPDMTKCPPSTGNPQMSLGGEGLKRCFHGSLWLNRNLDQRDTLGFKMTYHTSTSNSMISQDLNKCSLFMAQPRFTWSISIIIKTFIKILYLSSRRFICCTSSPSMCRPSNLCRYVRVQWW